jgi:golgin subfamily B member 1
LPEHPRALATLARLRADGGDHERAAALYQQAAALEPDAAEQARLYAAAAITFEDQLGQEDKAVELYTRALSAQADHEAASERLVDIYARRKQLPEAEALLDRQARRAAGDSERLAAIETRLGGVCLEAGNVDKALECFAKAYELSPESLPLLRMYGDLRFSRGDWKQAAELLASTLRLHWQALSAADVLDITLRLGRAHLELGNTDEAIKAYRDAKAASPQSRPAMEALSTLYASKADWAAWVAEREELAAVAERDDRAEIWEAIGDACAERLSDGTRAEAAYRKALESEPGRRSTLQKLLDIYTKASRWEPAVEILSEVAKIETDPAVRAKTLLTAAQLYKNELGRPTDAAAMLERCLDDAPEMVAAFNELEAMRRDAGDWKGLATSYRAMLERLPASAPAKLRLELWNRLADVALQRLRDKKLGMTALEESLAIDATDVARQEMLAHLYDMAGPEARERAIASHQRLIARDPHRTDSYLALAKLYGEIGEIDKQWCVAAALWYLKKTNPAMEILFRRYRPPQARPSRQPLGEEMWRRVLHPEEDRMLGELLAIAAPYLTPPAAQDPGTFGLKRKNLVELATDESLPSRVLVQLADTLGVAKPDVFRLDGETGQTTLFCLKDRAGPRPAILLGAPTQRRSSFDLVFDLGNVISFLRPERFLKYALRTPGALQMGVEVVLAMAAVPGFRVPAGQGAQLAAYLQREIPPAVVARLVDAGRALGERGGVDIAKWVATMDLSAGRVALALSGDLGAAFRVISGEMIPTSPVPIHRRMADLVAFSVSEDYFACRRHLGLTVA